MSSEPVNPDVLEVTQLVLTGHHEAARERFAVLWQSLASDDAFHRCVLAHYIADVQTDPSDELRWDLCALDAALSAPAALFDGRIPEVSRGSFLPSLHLNAAASHERLGQIAAAQRQALLADAAASQLGNSSLADLTRSAIVRICSRLGVGPGASTPFADEV